jgi:hypothetical protein
MWLAVSEHLNNVEGNTGVWRLSERYATIHYGSGRLDLHSCLKGVVFAPKRRAPLHAAAAAPMMTRCGISADYPPPQPPPLVPDGVSKRVPRPDADCPIMFSLTRGTRVSGPWQHPSGCAAAAGRQDSDGTAAAPVAGPSERGSGTAESGHLRPNAGIQGISGCHKGRQDGRAELDPSEQNKTMRSQSSHGTFLHLILSGFAIRAAPPKTVP